MIFLSFHHAHRQCPDGVQSVPRVARSLETPIGREPSCWASTVKFHPPVIGMTVDRWRSMYVFHVRVPCMYDIVHACTGCVRPVPVVTCDRAVIQVIVTNDTNPSNNSKDDEYQIAKECSRGWPSIASDEWPTTVSQLLERYNESITCCHTFGCLSV